MTPHDRARKLIADTKRAPRAFASRREAMMCHLCSIVRMVRDDFDAREFYKKHIGVMGSLFVSLDALVDDQWAATVIADAENHIPRERVYYYECHVTVEPVFDARLEQFKYICENHGFRVADLLMQKREEDTKERSKFDTFCSSRGDNFEDVEKRMLELMKTCAATAFKVWRYKIEEVVVDSKVVDEHGIIK